MEIAFATRRGVVFAAVCLLCVGLSSDARADFVAQWTFETSPPPDLNNSTTYGPIAADFSVGAATASGVHGSANTDWDTPVGNGSNNSLNSNTWAVGDFYQFAVSTLGFFDIKVSWDQTSSTTGPTTFDLAYSVNGGAFVTHLTNYAVGTTSWSSIGARNPISLISTDLSSITAVDGVSSLVFRLISKTAGSSTVGTNRVDNFFVEATAVPEPAAILFGCLVCCAVGSVIACRRLMGKLTTVEPTTV